MSKYHDFGFTGDRVFVLCGRVLRACFAGDVLLDSALEAFLLFVPPIDRFDLDKLLLFRINLNIPAFVQTAVRYKMNRDEILVYLHLITNTPLATEKV